MSSPDILQGSGTGSIKLGDAQSGSGKGRDGKVEKYASTGSMKDGVLRITQQFTVKFKVRFFSKTHSITMDYKTEQGSDIMVLIRNAQGKANLGRRGP